MSLVPTDDFVVDAVRRIAAAASGSAGGTFRLSLCGGSTPAPIYRALREAEIDWGRTVITFGDERCVPPDHAESNFRMADEALLQHVPIPAANIVRIEGERQPAEAAARCEAALRARAEDRLFVHDLVLLGMGEDGHTASLFPDTEALGERDRWVVANPVPQLATTRITFTFPLLNAARQVLFLIKGDTKRALAEQIAAGDTRHPAAHVHPDGELTWLVGS